MNYIKYILIGLFLITPAITHASPIYISSSANIILDSSGDIDYTTLTGAQGCLGIRLYASTTSSTAGCGLWNNVAFQYMPFIVYSLFGNGTHTIEFQFYDNSGGFTGYDGLATVVASSVNGSGGGIDILEQTQIITVFPTTVQATSSTFSLGASYYATLDDSSDDSIILKQTIELNTAPVLGNVWGGTGDIVASWSNAETFEYDLLLGSNIASTSYSSTQIGLRKVTTTITKQGFSLFGFDFGSNILLSTTTYFLIGTTTSGDSIDSSIQDAVNDITNTASSTVDLISVKCNPFNLNFNIPQCVLYLIIPSSGTASALMTQVQNDIFSRFPFGYFTDALNILATTSTTTINVVNATLPANLPGGGSNITLTLNNPLDSLLNATTSIYTNSSASSTQTYFEITYYYWKMLVSLLFVLYLMKRILPFINHSK